jgi:hypothetical protein
MPTSLLTHDEKVLALFPSQVEPHAKQFLFSFALILAHTTYGGGGRSTIFFYFSFSPLLVLGSEHPSTQNAPLVGCDASPTTISYLLVSF